MKEITRKEIKRDMGYIFGREVIVEKCLEPYEWEICTGWWRIDWDTLRDISHKYKILAVYLDGHTIAIRISSWQGCRD